jgi:hypothetical protein
MDWTMDDARRYIEEARWTYARTMPDWPHQYTVRAWRPDLDAAFVDLCRYIDAVGRADPWPPPPARPVYHNTYLVIDGWKYWAMGPCGDADPPESKTVVNRARVAQ